jgi:hypothetical protein
MLRKTAVGLTPFVRFCLRHSLDRGCVPTVRCYATPHYLPQASYTTGTLDEIWANCNKLLTKWYMIIYLK